MSRFDMIRDAGGDPQLASLYREITASGMGGPSPLNWFCSQGIRPDILAGTWALSKGVLFAGRLPATIKQMIVVLISSSNDCSYCRATHAQALQGMGVAADLIDSLTTDINLEKVPPTQRKILQFALQVSQNPQQITDGDVGDLRAYGLGDDEILEIIMVATFTNFINLWSDVSGIAVDEEGGA